MGFFRYSLAVVRWLKLNVYLLVRVVSYARKVSRKPRGGGILDISLGGEVRRSPSYPDPV